MYLVIGKMSLMVHGLFEDEEKANVWIGANENMDKVFLGEQTIAHIIGMHQIIENRKIGVILVCPMCKSNTKNWPVVSNLAKDKHRCTSCNYKWES